MRIQICQQIEPSDFSISFWFPGGLRKLGKRITRVTDDRGNLSNCRCVIDESTRIDSKI